MDEEPQLAPLTALPSLEGLDAEGRIEAMVTWFFENFEDPAHETPYDGREGGYQYIWGGPHEAADYIYDHFPEATEEEHSEAIERIDADGPYWAPAGHRVLPPDEDFDERPAPSLEERLTALAGQLDVLTGHVGEMLALQQKDAGIGIGHNNPPPDADDPPALNGMLESIAEIRAELARPDPKNDATEEIVTRSEGRFAQFLTWFRNLVQEAPTLIVKGAIGGVGTLLVNYAVKHQAEIMTAASIVAETVSDWAVYLNSIF